MGKNKAEKRSIFTDALETLGTIITNKPGCARDAIHIAVEPCIASAPHHPGERIGIAYDEGIMYSLPVYGPKREVIGIVDPFLTHPVEIGEVFWFLVLPRQITSLRHVWDHPKFHPSDTNVEIAGPSPDSQKTDSKQRLEYFATSVGLTYDELMTAAKEWVEYGEYLIDGGKFEGVAVDENFWEHFHQITHLRGNGNFFSCSC